MNKKFAAIGTIVILTTGSGAAHAQISDLSSSTTEQATTQVTKPTPIINSPVTKEVVVSGPVKYTSLETGPVLTSDPPLVGSVDWMAQEKAEKDKLKSDAQKKQDELKSDAQKKQDELEAEIGRLEKIASDTKKLNDALFLVKKQVGKTPWVFGGSTPSAWDCSGMIRWAYAHLGIDLEHSATKQRLSGVIVTEPKIGDLVSFNHRTYDGGAYHIGIYAGPDEMIHAGGKPGDKTEIHSIREWSKDNRNSQITYTRIIETNN